MIGIICFQQSILLIFCLDIIYNWNINAREISISLFRMGTLVPMIWLNMSCSPKIGQSLRRWFCCGTIGGGLTGHNNVWAVQNAFCAQTQPSSKSARLDLERAVPPKRAFQRYPFLKCFDSPCHLQPPTAGHRILVPGSMMVPVAGRQL